MTSGLLGGGAVIAVLLVNSPSIRAQATTQLWGNITVNWVKSERLVYELDFEPKGLLDAPEGDPDWKNLDVTPNVEYSPKAWMDVVVDTTVGSTKQTDDLNTIEVTPRLGVRFHLFSRAQRFHPRERAPRRRIVGARPRARRVPELLLFRWRDGLRFNSALPQSSRVPRAAEQGAIPTMALVICSPTGSGSFHSTILKSASPTGNASAVALATVEVSIGGTSALHLDAVAQRHR